VAPTGSGSEEDDDLPDDFAGVIRLHKDAAQKQRTATLIAVSIDGPMVCSAYNKAGIGSEYALSATTIVNGHPRIVDWMNAEQAWC